MLKAVDKRVSWLKRTIEMFEMVFPTEEPKCPIENWLAELDNTLGGNIKILQMIMPWHVMDMIEDGCFLDYSR